MGTLSIVIAIVVIAAIIGAVIMYRRGMFHYGDVDIDNYKKPFYIQSAKSGKYLYVTKDKKSISMVSDTENATQFTQNIIATKIPVLQKRGYLDNLPFTYIFGSSKLILVTPFLQITKMFIVPDLGSPTQPAEKEYKNFLVDYNNLSKPAVEVYDDFFSGDRPGIDSCLINIVPA